MKTFTDTQGVEWPISVTTAGTKRVRAMLGVDLFKVNDGSLFDELGDPVTLVDVLYVLCKPLADERKMTDEQFGEHVPPAALDDIADAIVTGAIALLYPAARREAVSNIWEGIRAARQRFAEKLTAGLAAIDASERGAS